MNDAVYMKCSETGAWRAFVRWDGKDVELRAFGPKAPDHVTCGVECPVCRKPLCAGQITTLVPLGPGDNPEYRARHVAARFYNAATVECHFACITGAELEYREGPGGGVFHEVGRESEGSG